MSGRYLGQQAGARWGIISLLFVLLSLLLSTGVIQVGVAQASPRDDGDGAGALFGPLVHSFASLRSYQQHMIITTNPVVLFLFNREGNIVPNFWAPLLRNVSNEFQRFGVEVAEVASSSEAGKALMEATQASSSTAIFFFQGVGETPTGDGKGLKIPIGFTGKVDLANILSWGLACISSSVTHRVHNDADLARFFAKYPKYPGLPHVLYFPSSNYTPGGYLALSQHFSSDAVFGVVPNPFDTPDAAAIAQRYNITRREELPALLLLLKADTAESAGQADHVLRMSTSSAPFSYSSALEFLSTHITDTVASLLAKAESTKNPHFVNIAETRRLYMATQLIEQQLDIVEEERRSQVREPIVVRDQATWAKECVRLPRESRCLAVFVDSTQEADAQEKAVKVLSQVSLKLMGMNALNVSLVVVDKQGSGPVRDYFDVGQNGFPDVLLLSLNRPAKYFHFVGAFSAERLLQFVVAHSTKRGQEVVPGGRTFIPHMVPKLEEVADVSPHGGSEDDGDL